jgi:drug/metabolite transporter (DMT)-like permease
MSAVAVANPGTRLDASTAIAVVITVVAWASAFPAIRAGLAAFGPAELGAIRFAIAAVPSAIFLALTRPGLPSWSEAWRFAFGGVVFVALYTILLNFGELTVSAGPASFIINVNPILTAFMAMLMLGERFSLLAWVGTFISFVGIGLIALGEGEGLRIDQGALLILGAALCTASASIVQKPLFARHKPLTVSAWNMVIGALALSPFLPSGLEQAALASAEGLGAAIYLGTVPSLVAYGSWAVALSRLPASRASNFLFCVPPVATLIGYVWLGEVPGVASIVGGLLALGGVAIVNLKRQGVANKE